MFGRYSPPGWAVSDWAGGCLGGTYLGTGRSLTERYSPPGLAVSGWAGLRRAASTCVP